jgi:hypothetical protein
MALLLAIGSPTVRGADLARIDASIQRAVNYLYSVQKDGLWEIAPAKGPYAANIGHYGGLTAIATYALLAAGESPHDPKLVKAVDFLKQLQTKDAYVLGMRAQIWR